MSGYAVEVQASKQVIVSEAPQKRSRWLYLPMLHPRYRAIQEFTEQAPDMTMPFLGAPADATADEVRTLWLQSRKDAATILNIEANPEIFVIWLGIPSVIVSLVSVVIEMFIGSMGFVPLVLLPAIFAGSGMVMAAILDARTERLSRDIISIRDGGWQAKLLDAIQKVQKHARHNLPVIINTVASLLEEGNTMRDRLTALSPGDQVALMRLSTRMYEVSARRMSAGVELDGDTAELLHRAAAAMEPNEDALARIRTKEPVVF